jgi:acid phosphatase type 7
MRSIALVLVTALGTLAVLVGVVGLLDDTARGGASSPSGGVSRSSTAPPSGSPIGTDASPSDPPSTGPSIPPRPSGDPVLVGAGDIARCDGNGDEETARLLDRIPGDVFTAGDNAYESGTAEEFARCYDPTWGRHKARTYPTPGNHDHETDGLAGYLGYFGEGVGTADEPWYSFDLGLWHVVMLDSMCEAVPGGCGRDSPQVEWLREDLAANPARCTLAIWHHPRFSSGVHGDDPDVGPFWDVLHEAGADLIVNGHDHDYERFAPQAPDGTADPERGIRQFVVGTGGATLRDFPRTAANSELRANVSHGVIALTLRPTGYAWEFVPTEGRISDRGAAACH